MSNDLNHANNVPPRSILFAPADDARKLSRALSSDADAIVADLEDSVILEKKAWARELLRDALGEPNPTSPRRFVRVNADTAELEADLAALKNIDIDGLMVPKATPESVRLLGNRPLIAVIESAAGVLRAGQIARTDGVSALLLGSVDLALELRLQPGTDGLELLVPSSMLVLESAAAGIQPPIDGVHLALGDLEGLERRARYARSVGFGGKACIHPDQVPIVNNVFTPTAEELEEARSIVAVYEQAVRSGTGATTHDGQMVDLPVAEHARRLLAEAKEQSRANT
jgi:citrate lyase beta subunit